LTVTVPATLSPATTLSFVTTSTTLVTLSSSRFVRQVAWTRLSELESKRRFKPRGTFTASARRFFGDALQLPLDRDGERWMRLVDLETIRNAFAHANGLEDGMTSEKWHELKRVASRQQTPVLEWHDMLVPPAAFVRSSFEDVASSARDLVARARKAPRAPRPSGRA
jgi:hypothetical protein